MNKMEFGPKTAEQYVADMYKRIGSFEGGYDPKSDPNLKDVILDRDTLERIIYGQTLDPQVPKTPQGAAPAARIDWGTF